MGSDLNGASIRAVIEKETDEFVKDIHWLVDNVFDRVEVIFTVEKLFIV